MSIVRGGALGGAYLVPQRDVDTVAVRKPSLKKEGDGGEEGEG